MTEDARKARHDPALKQAVRRLYTGHDARGVRFRYALIVFDVLSIAFFIATAGVARESWIVVINYLLGSVILMDFAARLWIEPRKRWYLTRIYVLADIIVVSALFFGPLLFHDVGTLRVLRGLRLLHAYHLLHDLRRGSPFFRRHEDALIASVNLFVFVFVVTSVVYVLEFEGVGGPAEYVDALYFTVSTLTTTGFGDITLPGATGKLLSVFIMVFGVALFLRLAQAIFQPSKVKYTCATCGLNRHEKDAIHCKHCGTELAIETEGATF